MAQEPWPLQAFFAVLQELWPLHSLPAVLQSLDPLHEFTPTHATEALPLDALVPPLLAQPDKMSAAAPKASIAPLFKVDVDMFKSSRDKLLGN